MQTKYFKNSNGAILARNYDDKLLEQLKAGGANLVFLDEKSEEVQVYLAAVAERDAEALAKAQAAEDAADEVDERNKILHEIALKNGLQERIKKRKALRQAERKADKGKQGGAMFKSASAL